MRIKYISFNYKSIILSMDNSILSKTFHAPSSGGLQTSLYPIKGGNDPHSLA